MVHNFRFVPIIFKKWDKKLTGGQSVERTIMKKFFYYFAIIAIIAFSFWRVYSQNKLVVEEKIQKVTGINLSCLKPFRYTIGTVDPRFNLSADDLLLVAKDAEKTWDRQSGRNLFEYDPESQFKINLIFDERQSASNEADELSQSLEQLEASHQKITNQYEDLSGTYAQKVAKYNQNVAGYEGKLKKYNDEVDYWNKHGGISDDKYDDLKSDKNALGDLHDKLEKERAEVNSLAGKTNALVSKEKSVVNEYNASVSTYKIKYGGGREFEKGLYDGIEINIYQFKQTADLRLTIVHELGHALGIGHIDDPKSIMYYLLSDQNMENPQLSMEDLNALKATCKFK
jgi:flagellar biosynthesis chaperone FliJ